MGHIYKLDENEIRSYVPLSYGSEGSSGSGAALETALSEYNKCLSETISASFGAKDKSNAHAVLDAVSAQMLLVGTCVEGLDVMIDALIAKIDSDILAYEDSTASSLESQLGD
ncbi:MAG: hypothetical protein K6F83_03320 [Clostridiales bacterium]|nr:hypothetical protein [Clostridiales bacterium]